MTKQVTTERSFSKFSRRLRDVQLYEDVERRALAHHVTLRDLYEGPDRAPSISTARRAVYNWLHGTKKLGVREIARLFDRVPIGVWKMTRKNGR